MRAYLENNGALLERPIERLRKMNPLSIELYQPLQKRHHAASRLEFAINNQHMNGGLAVDTWGQTSLAGMLCSRRSRRHAWRDASRWRGAQRGPGVRARAAPNTSPRDETSKRLVRPSATSSKARSPESWTSFDRRARSRAIKAEVQPRMSDHAGIVCNAGDVKKALAGATPSTYSIPKAPGQVRRSV